MLQYRPVGMLSGWLGLAPNEHERWMVMDLKERLRRALVDSRLVTERLLSEIEDPQDWVRRVVPGTNHALWIAGHLAAAENAFIGRVSEDRKVNNAQYAALFGKGSSVSDSLADYPSPDEILAYMRERRSVYLELLDGLAPSDLERPTTGGPPFMFDVGSVYQMSVWHEGLHTGQLTMIHRALGKTPLADRTA